MLDCIFNQYIMPFKDIQSISTEIYHDSGSVYIPVWWNKEIRAFSFQYAREYPDSTPRVAHRRRWLPPLGHQWPTHHTGGVLSGYVLYPNWNLINHVDFRAKWGQVAVLASDVGYFCSVLFYFESIFVPIMGSHNSVIGFWARYFSDNNGKKLPNWW